MNIFKSECIFAIVFMFVHVAYAGSHIFSGEDLMGNAWEWNYKTFLIIGFLSTTAAITETRLLSIGLIISVWIVVERIIRYLDVKIFESSVFYILPIVVFGLVAVFSAFYLIKEGSSKKEVFGWFVLPSFVGWFMIYWLENWI